MPMFTSSTIGSYASKWLIATGVFELLLAGGFVFGAIAAPDARSGLLLTAVILGAVGIGLVFFGIRSRMRAEEAKRVLSVGLTGTATITAMTQTGMYLNENPQVKMDLLVQVPGRAPYQATRKEFIPLILLGRLSSGAPLAVKVDPNDPQDVVIDWENPAPVVTTAPEQGWWAQGQGSPPGVTTITAPPVVTIGGVQVSGPGAPAVPATPGAPSGMPSAPFTWPTVAAAPTGGQAESLAQVQAALQAAGIPAHQVFSFAGQDKYQVDQLRAAVRANGIEGTATVDSLQDTTVEIGDEHLFVIESTVTVPGRPPHKSGPSAAMIPKTKVGHIALGQTVPVMVAKDNPDLVMFEWEKIP